jgi:hypothetical protein
MRAALCARVSTQHKGQETANQVLQLPLAAQITQPAANPSASF